MWTSLTCPHCPHSEGAHFHCSLITAGVKLINARKHIQCKFSKKKTYSLLISRSTTSISMIGWNKSIGYAKQTLNFPNEKSQNSTLSRVISCQIPFSNVKVAMANKNTPSIVSTHKASYKKKRRKNRIWCKNDYIFNKFLILNHCFRFLFTSIRANIFSFNTVDMYRKSFITNHRLCIEHFKAR